MAALRKGKTGDSPRCYRTAWNKPRTSHSAQQTNVCVLGVDAEEGSSPLRINRRALPALGYASLSIDRHRLGPQMTLGQR